jgi:predicted nucleic acid-binding protein
MIVGIVDSTVIIHIFRNDPAALAWAVKLEEQLAVTSITWLEVMHGASSKAGQAKCKAILSEFDLVYLTQTDQEWAMQQVELYRLSHGVGIHDSLIASVSHRFQVPLYTHNLKDMRVLLGDILPQKPY